MKKTSFLLIVGILAAVFTASYTGYLYWQKSATQSNIQQAEKTLAYYEAKLTNYEGKEVSEAINAKKMKAKLDLESIKWSTIITKIRNTVPVRDGVPLVGILSYSGSTGNEISMNVKTNPDSAKPYFDVADLIAAFDSSKYFTDNFVPSISSGTDDKGKQVLTFVLTTKYIAPSDEAELNGAINDILNESLSPSAPVLR